MATPLSGTQYRLVSGDYTATIASVGASIRQLTHRGRDVVRPFDADEVRPYFRGATLAPWPNRVIDGRYTFDGAEQQLALTEPERGNALHGLMVWVDYDAVERSEDSVVLAATVQPQAGWPFRLDLRIAFALDGDGLHTTVTALNTGPTRAPFGTAPHPYLVAGGGGERVDDWTLSLPASQVQEVTPDRLIPTGLADVAGTDFDFREPRAIGTTFLDHAFTGLEPNADGRTAVRVTAADGHGAELSWPTGCAWVQVHTADLPDESDSRRGLAVEPMTCPPAALNSGTDLLMIEPGDTVDVRWTIAAV